MRLLSALAIAFSDDGVAARNACDRGVWVRACSVRVEYGGEEVVHRIREGAVRTPHKAVAYGVRHAVVAEEEAERQRPGRLVHKFRLIHRHCLPVPEWLPVLRTGSQSPDSVCQGGE